MERWTGWLLGTELDEVEVLGRLDMLHETQRRAESEVLQLVSEFCAADFGARLQLTPWAAHRLIADALDLRHRMPQLWRRVQALEVKVSYDHGAVEGAGRSRIGDYGPMTPFHHRIRTFGLRKVKQPFPGVFLWRDPTERCSWSTTPALDAS